MHGACISEECTVGIKQSHPSYFALSTVYSILGISVHGVLYLSLRPSLSPFISSPNLPPNCALPCGVIAREEGGGGV